MDRKKIAGIFFFGLIVFSMFSFVSAADSALFSSLKDNKLFGPIFDLFGFTSSEGFATFLLAVLVIMMVYSLMSFVPFFGDSVGVQWAASIIIGVLAFLYVDVSRVRALLLAYESLGFVLAGVIPFLIVVAFTIKLETGKNTQGKISTYIISNTVLGVFLGYIFFKAIGEDSTFRIWMWVLFVAGIFWMISKKSVLKKAASSVADKVIELNRIRTKKSVERDRTNADAMDSAAEYSASGGEYGF